MRTLLLGFLAAAVAFASPARTENVVVASAIEGFVKPAYAHFHSVSAQLRGEMDALCADQSPDKYAATQSTFLTLVTAWSEVETIRFGPVTEENRLERILFWPDRKSIGLKQVQAALAEKDASVTDVRMLKDKSVAMQGLGALEFVLFGTGSEALNEPGDPHRCAYGQAVAKNIEDMAGAILAGWQDPNGISKQWANPGPDNALYRTDDEALAELFDIFVHGLEMIRDVRLNGFLGQTPKDDKPKQAIYWRSGATVTSVRGNLGGLRTLFDTSGLAGRLPADSQWVTQSIGFEFANAERMTDIAAGPILEVLADEKERGGLVVTRLITSHLSELFGVTLAQKLGLSAGFSSLDGD
jgi:predicted lipoprotein